MFEDVTKELDRWAEIGRRARLWLRDDDAIEVTAGLERLGDMAARHDVPMLLAVVPMPARTALGAYVDGHRHLSAAVHGHRHKSHAAAGEKSIELGGRLAPNDVCDQLVAARERLETLCPGSMTGILVPPWNRIAPTVVARLPGLGFSCLSTFGNAHEAAGIEGIVQLNTHLDIIDWKGSRGGRDPAWLCAELVKLLSAARGNGDPAIGVLTHHLVHDNAAWGFLERLFQSTARHPGAAWCDVRELTGNGRFD